MLYNHEVGTYGNVGAFVPMARRFKGRFPVKRISPAARAVLARAAALKMVRAAAMGSPKARKAIANVKVHAARGNSQAAHDAILLRRAARAALAQKTLAARSPHAAVIPAVPVDPAEPLQRTTAEAVEQEEQDAYDDFESEDTPEERDEESEIDGEAEISGYGYVGAFGWLKKGFKKIGKGLKSIVKSKYLKAGVAVLAVVYPPVGVPAAAAVASANVVIKAAEKGKPKAKDLIKGTIAAAAAGDPDAARAAKVMNIVAEARKGNPKAKEKIKVALKKEGVVLGRRSAGAPRRFGPRPMTRPMVPHAMAAPMVRRASAAATGKSFAGLFVTKSGLVLSGKFQKLA